MLPCSLLIFWYFFQKYISIMERVTNGMGTHSLYPKFWNVSLLRLMLSYVHENYNEK